MITKLDIKEKDGFLIMDDFPTNCIFNKVKTGCGATTIALTNNENYIIAVPTTAMLIYTGKSLSDKQVNNVLQGEEFIFPKDAKVDIERGNKFINLCKAAKMDVSFITKRYFIKGFNSHAISTSEEQAFKALDNLKYKNYKEDKWKGVKSENDFIKILKEALEA